MPLTSTVVSVTTSAVEIAPMDPRRRRVYVHNFSGSGTTYIGDSGVTVAAGYDLAPGERIELVEAHVGDVSLSGAIYAINSAGTNTVRVLAGTD